MPRGYEKSSERNAFRQTRAVCALTVLAGVACGGVALASPAVAQTSHPQLARLAQPVQHNDPSCDCDCCGEQGPQGPQGLQGPIGPQGPAGPTGSAGPQGPAGPTGKTGPQGTVGPTGATGPASPDISAVFEGETELWAKAPGSGLTYLLDSRNPGVWVNISGLANYPGNVTDVQTSVQGNDLHVTVLNPSNVVAETVCTVNPGPVTAASCTAFTTLPPRP
ncbi:collagen-like protein [Streptacidiphilus jiangxiensis]|uniref:Collagen triple helix repeat-containing protein n=1 Tax=Streptacidiphilus jiangxiensis TaxID=235985 RepID=A0A1H7WFQ4_STRJI|nr:collagen-like protein [Streptacidiphilus jiangxiensis]SEM19899.1 Collagen triple helix repeat-containing protein [Streptacidiphilus jiangxiensis]